MWKIGSREPTGSIGFFIMAKLTIHARFGIVPNDLLNSSNISFKAKGLYAFIQSKPDAWDFSAERISNQVKEGLPSIISGLKELESNGYLQRKKYQNKLGHFEIEYILYENPFVENLYTGNPFVENPLNGKPSNNSKKDLSKKENNLLVSNKKKSIEERKNEFLQKLSEHSDKLGVHYNDFVGYWTESDQKENMRFEKEKFFEISRRIATWLSRAKPFKKPEQKGKIQKNFENISEACQDILTQIEDGTFINPFTIQ